jgi:hypothetical protein
LVRGVALANAISIYLASIAANLRLEPSTREGLLRELETHIEDRVEEFKKEGLSEDEAAAESLKVLGPAGQVTREMNEAYSQGSWSQTLMASLPHALFGLAFILNWFSSAWLLLLLLFVVGVAILGWVHGRPNWIFPWLGYTLVPVVVAGVSLLYLPRGWSWVAFFIYVPLTLRLFYIITLQTIRKDWLYSSLMFFHAPIIIGWSLVVWHHELPGFNMELLQGLAPWIGLSFLGLATTVAAFIRLRQRWLKIATLFVAGGLTLALVIYNASDMLSTPAFILIITLMFGLFLLPVLVERRLKRDESHFAAEKSSRCRT